MGDLLAKFIDFVYWMSVIIDAVGLLITPFAIWYLDKVGISWILGIFALIAVIVELIYNIICHRKIQRLFTDGNDLLTVRRGLLKFRRSERLQMLIAVPLIILWIIAIMWQLGVFAHTQELIRMSLAIIIGLLICFGLFAWEMHRINNSIREIDDLATE